MLNLYEGLGGSPSPQQTQHIIENKNILALFNNSLKGKKVIKRHKQSHIYCTG